jgi:hypothetical protein
MEYDQLDFSDNGSLGIWGWIDQSFKLADDSGVQFSSSP